MKSALTESLRLQVSLFLPLSLLAFLTSNNTTSDLEVLKVLKVLSTQELRLILDKEREQQAQTPPIGAKVEFLWFLANILAFLESAVSA